MTTVRGAILPHSSFTENPSERNLRLIVDGMPGLVSLLTPAGELELVNPQLAEYCGRTLEELKRWGTSDAVHTEDLPRVVKIFTQSIASGDPYDFEARLRRFDGVYRWFQVRGLPVRDTNGRIVRWCSLNTDIDERKRAEEARKRSEAFLAEGQRLSRVGSLSWRVERRQRNEFVNSFPHPNLQRNFLD